MSSATEAAESLRLPTAEVRAAWRRLHDVHAHVLDRTGTEIDMANPSSAAPTPYRVRADRRWWFANCAWDAFGVCALHFDGDIETTCADCGQPLRIGVRAGRPDDTSLLFHCLVPARHW